MKIKIFSILLALVSFQVAYFPARLLAQAEKLPPSEIPDSQGNSISEKQVENLISEIKKANKSKDTETLVKYFAPFIYSQMTVKTDSTSETLELNGLSEHRQYLEKQYERVKETEDLFEGWQTLISADGQMAFVTRTRMVNVITEDGRKLLVSSNARARLAMVAGELKVISIEEVAEVDLRPQS